MVAKVEMMWELRKMLRDVLTLKSEGSTHPRMARAHGYVDGYMRGILEGGVATRDELLRLVAEEREAASGPATRSITMAESVA
jgi:hypothetical protein